MKQFKLFIPVLFILSVQCIQAQVTIGTNKPPMHGALLDISQGTAVGDKGMGLPRVNLTKLDPGTDAELAASIGGTGSYSKSDHIGLVVYNLREDLCNSSSLIYEGMYVWEGNRWEYLGNAITRSNEVYELIDNRDPANPEKYLYRTFGSAGTWMVQNMRARSFDSEAGTSMTFPAAPSWGDKSTPNWSYPGLQNGNGKDPQYYENNPSIGLLYNLAGALGLPEHSNNTQIQGICPNGWYIPTITEFQELFTEINANPDKYTTSNQQGNYNLFTNCDLKGLGEIANARSKSANMGGFAMYYLCWIHMGQLWNMGTNGAIFWCSGLYGSGNAQMITNILDTGNGIAESYWTDSGERSQTVVRCKKKP